MAVLRCKVVENAPERAIFRIFEEEQPAALDALTQIARIADVLLRENSLLGSFVAEDGGIVALVLPQGKRTFFHNGIVFAALDAVNDPVRNPTLNLLAEPEKD